MGGSHGPSSPQGHVFWSSRRRMRHLYRHRCRRIGIGWDVECDQVVLGGVEDTRPRDVAVQRDAGIFHGGAVGGQMDRRQEVGGGAAGAG